MTKNFILSTADRGVLTVCLGHALGYDVLSGDARAKANALLEMIRVKPDEAEEAQLAPAAPWKKVSPDRYADMLEAVPPAFMSSGHFLVGEAHDIRKCNVTGQFRSTYRAFISDNGDYFEGPPMTRDEFIHFLEQPHRVVLAKLRPTPTTEG